MNTEAPDPIRECEAEIKDLTLRAQQAEHERRIFKSDLWAERTEHRMTKTTLSALAAERNQLRRALAQVAEDCTAWLHSESDEPSVEFVKAVRQYAHEQSQAPLKSQISNL